MIKILRIPIPKYSSTSQLPKRSNIETYQIPSSRVFNPAPRLHYYFIKRYREKWVEWKEQERGERIREYPRLHAVACSLINGYRICEISVSLSVILTTSRGEPRWLPASFCPANEMVVATPLPPPLHVRGQSPRRDATAKITPRRGHA